MPRLALLACLLALAGCTSTERGGGGATPDPTPVAPGGGPTCGPVRLTRYTGGARGWCEFDRTLPVLPASVRAGLTFAIGEPWSGGSYEGAAGEACGECWELDTIAGPQTVMVHDLCPIDGNPLCAGGFFHFDLSAEAASALGVTGLEAGSARRVACPVTGNVHLELLDRNASGYLRFAVLNHRVPVRLVEYRAAGSGTWRAAERDGGPWHVRDGGDAFGAAAPGGLFRLTSAQGEVLESPRTLEANVARGAVFDLGVQLADLSPTTGPTCTFRPPADVYVDGYGGIDRVRWTMNPWGGAAASETSQGCRAGSCVRVDGLAPGRGFHVYYLPPFPSSTFASLSLQVRAAAGSGAIEVAASRGGTPCARTSVTVGDAWTPVAIDLAATCAGRDTLDAVTVYGGAGSGLALLLDDVRFLP